MIFKECAVKYVFYIWLLKNPVECCWTGLSPLSWKAHRLNLHMKHEITLKQHYMSKARIRHIIFFCSGYWIFYEQVMWTKGLRLHILFLCVLICQIQFCVFARSTCFEKVSLKKEFRLWNALLFPIALVDNLDFICAHVGMCW